MTRTVNITNRHPRLRVPRVTVARMITLLDAEFSILPADKLPSGLSHKSKVISHKSPVPPGELSLVFLTDPALAKIHGDFMADPTATDVITFEGDRDAGLAGEICVSADTALRYVEGRAQSRVKRVAPKRAMSRDGQTSALGSSALHPSPTLQNAFATELTLYVVHGWLHLAGYDDLQPAKKRRMRAAEARAMKLLRDARAIPAFRIK